MLQVIYRATLTDLHRVVFTSLKYISSKGPKFLIVKIWLLHLLGIYHFCDIEQV